MPPVSLDDIHDPASRYNLIRREGNSCLYCGEAIAYERKECSDTIRWGTRDHVVPKSKGGPTTAENMVAACYPCNAFKQNNSLLVLLRKVIDGPLPWDRCILISKADRDLVRNWTEYNRWKSIEKRRTELDNGVTDGQGTGRE